MTFSIIKEREKSRDIFLGFFLKKNNRGWDWGKNQRHIWEGDWEQGKGGERERLLDLFQEQFYCFI